MSEKVYIDGEFFDKADAKISVFDHGLLYGDGLFEGIRAYNGKVFLCDEHINRLYEGAGVLLIDIPISKEEMIKAINEALKVNNLTDAYIRLIVTRGAGTLGLSPYECSSPSVIIIAASIALYPSELYETGLEIVTVAVPAVNPEALNPRIKSLNYLSNIMAKVEGLNAGCQEALMLNAQGNVAECTGDNIFIIKNGELITPPVSAGILEGCTRNAVMDIAREMGLTVSERDMQRYDLYTADECFLTGTAAEIIAVIKIDNRQIGEGKPGEITKKLLAGFRALIAKG